MLDVGAMAFVEAVTTCVAAVVVGKNDEAFLIETSSGRTIGANIPKPKDLPDDFLFAVRVSKARDPSGSEGFQVEFIDSNKHVHHIGGHLPLDEEPASPMDLIKNLLSPSKKKEEKESKPYLHQPSVN